MSKYFFLLLALFFSSFTIYAQYGENLTFVSGDYKFNSVYDSVNYCSALSITKNGKEIFKGECSDMISSINEYDLEGNGKKQIIIEYYTGGAHCCTYLAISQLKENSLVILDTLFLGNVSYQILDLDNNGKKEILTMNDMFAYAFTNFAQSQFPIAIYQFRNNKLKFVNDEFEKVVLKDIDELEKQLKEYTSAGFECPKDASDDTFNTDAGAVKALLAPIVADYFSIGRTEEGYDRIKKVYKCPDRDNFIKILKNEFKLK
ncbi:MAG: hypothetical protein EHM58_13710 [Ignavibacteriae bacterium]|nr:MAG: hypothetical protein EHM58_13710 [Ignavibacteriota bacterium]